MGLSLSPLDTVTFIRLHDEVYVCRYAGGLPKECVYDQTKMVVICEQFRELEVSQRFYGHALLDRSNGQQEVTHGAG
ncbi:hypothetical protein HIR79_11835 [Halomonas sp. PGE1]|nr:hypothetical protein HIR79_11835 [Halomonas sp. PGE1]